MDHAIVHVAVSPLTCASTPVIGRHSNTRALLLDIVARIQLAVVACGTGIRNKARHSSVVYGRRGRVRISVRTRRGIHLRAGIVVLRNIPIGNVKRVGVAPKGSWVEFHAGSHVDVLLPGLSRHLLRANHGERGSKLEFRRRDWCGAAGRRVGIGHTRCDGHRPATISRARLNRGTIPSAYVAAHSNTAIVLHSPSHLVTVGATAACHSLAVAAQATLIHGLSVARNEVVLGKYCRGQANCQFEYRAHWEKL